ATLAYLAGLQLPAAPVPAGPGAAGRTCVPAAPPPTATGCPPCSTPAAAAPLDVLSFLAPDALGAAGPVAAPLPDLLGPDAAPAAPDRASPSPAVQDDDRSARAGVTVAPPALPAAPALPRRWPVGPERPPPSTTGANRAAPGARGRSGKPARAGVQVGGDRVGNPWKARGALRDLGARLAAGRVQKFPAAILPP
ncbi:unnamed protein product, partial [Prorocentrum cordatum]